MPTTKNLDAALSVAKEFSLSQLLFSSESKDEIAKYSEQVANLDLDVLFAVDAEQDLADLLNDIVADASNMNTAIKTVYQRNKDSGGTRSSAAEIIKDAFHFVVAHKGEIASVLLYLDNMGYFKKLKKNIHKLNSFF